MCMRCAGGAGDGWQHELAVAFLRSFLPLVRDLLRAAQRSGCSPGSEAVAEARAIGQGGAGVGWRTQRIPAEVRELGARERKSC